MQIIVSINSWIHVIIASIARAVKTERVLKKAKKTKNEMLRRNGVVVGSTWPNSNRLHLTPRQHIITLFYRPDDLPDSQPIVSKYWWYKHNKTLNFKDSKHNTKTKHQPLNYLRLFFYSARNARIASAVLATAIPYVCLSVRHTPVLCQNDGT